MALTIKQRYINRVSKHLPWLPQKAIVPLSAITAAVPALIAVAFTYGAMVSLQPETASISGSASVVNDATASNGQSVRFNTATTTCNLNATPATFSAQVAAATTGQTVCLAAGDYGTWNGVAKQITVIAPAGVVATIGLNFGLGDRDMTIDNLQINGATIYGNSSNYGSTDRPQNITVRNSDFTGPADISYVTNSNILLDNDTFININTNSTCTQAPARVWVSGDAGMSGVTLQNSFLSGGNTDGVQAGLGMNIINNEFYNIHELSANDCAHTDAIQLYSGNGSVIRGNYIHETADGIVAYDGTANVLIDNNVLDIKNGRYGIELYSDNTSTIRHNTLVYGTGCAFEPCGGIFLDHKPADPAGTGTIVENNIATTFDQNNGSTAAINRNNMLRSGATGANFNGTPTYVGGSTLNSFEDYLLTGSSAGVNAGFDGTNVGAHPRS